MSCHIVVMMDVLRLYMLAPYVEESSLRQFQKFFKLLKGWVGHLENFVETVVLVLKSSKMLKCLKS